MSAESIVAALGLGELLAADVLAVQLLILGGTISSFVVSLALMIMAGRSARSARLARSEAEGLLRSAQDFAVEARQLAAKLDKGGERVSAAAPQSAPATRVSARETTPEAEVEIITLKEQDRAARNLEAAKDAASVPSRLLGGFRPRRR